MTQKVFYTDKTVFILIGKFLKFLLSILNSRLIDFTLRKTIANSLGSKGLQLAKIYVEKIPIPKISKSEQKPFETLVDYILFLKEKEEDKQSFYFEQIIDGMVYELYFKKR